MKRFFYFFLFAGIFISETAWGQGSGSQDSTGLPNPALRPRRDTYIIEPFPSPAQKGQIVTIGFYNHNPQQVSLDILDVLGRVIKQLQPAAMLANGIHSYPFPTAPVAAGTYYIRLTTYTSTGALDIAQNLRFIVVH